MTARQVSRRRWREYEGIAGHNPYFKPWDHDYLTPIVKVLKDPPRSSPRNEGEHFE